MGTITDKINYLSGTKSQLKDMINYGLPTENQITNETTFRNYVKGIFEAFIESLRDSTTLYTNLPKISGNGTQITLNDTANAPMRITLKASELSQASTPTPDSPQDIHTISGDNSIQIDGENLCNTFIATKPSWQSGTLVVNDDGSFTLSGNTGSNNYFQLNQKLKEICPSLKGGDIAYLYLDTTSSSKRIYISGMGGAGWLDGTSLTITDTLLNNAVVIYGGYNQTDTIKITITKAQVATEYVPYQEPQTSPINLDTIEYCKIGNYEDEFILTSGKNLFDIDTFKNLSTFNTYETHNNIECLKLVGRTITYNLNCKENTQYTFQFKYIDKTTADIGNFQILYSDGTASDVRYSGQMTTSGTIYSATSTANKTITGIKWDAWNAGASIYIDKNSMQLEKGTSATTYEPYGTNQWYLKKNIGKVVLDGTENWSERTNIGGKHQFNAPTGVTNIVANANQLQQVSNYGVFNYSVYNYGAIGDFAILSNTKVLCINVDTNAVLNDFKTQLVSENLIVYYAYATPAYTQITGTLETQLNNIYKNMLSYKGTTNVSQINNDLPFALGVSAIQDLE